MKYRFVKICSLCLVPALIVSLAGCDKTIVENSGYILQDCAVYPAQTAPYEAESKAAIDEFYAVANEYTDSDGDIDYDVDAVQSAAQKAAAQLYAYACYNEEYLDKYVYFSDQSGYTDLGSTGSSTATKQDYKLIIHENETVCGYKYHYTIKNVDEATGLISAFKSSFESCKLRFVEAETNNLYRFNGEDVDYDDDGYLTCTWKKDSGQDPYWGSDEDEPAIVKRSGDKLTIDGIAEDIVTTAEEDPSNAAIHGNINILAENVIDYAYVIRTTIEDTDYVGYTVIMRIDTDVANADGASAAMLQESNSSSDCAWSDDKLSITFQIWDNGLFYQYSIGETWEGEISGFSGSVKSTTKVVYSYSDRDTDMTDKLAMLAKAKEE